MKHPVSEAVSCHALFVTDEPFLDDTPEPAGFRALFRALAALGVRCEVICRGLFAGQQDTDLDTWLRARNWVLDSLDAGGVDEVLPGERAQDVLRAAADGLPFTLFRGSSTKPHTLEGEDRIAFRRLLDAVIAQCRPDVMLAWPGPCLADILAAARGHNIAAVAFQGPTVPRDPEPFRGATVILAPTPSVASYLREAFGLVSVHLPLPVVPLQANGTWHGSAPLLFDGLAFHHAKYLFIQLAVELHRRRPDIPLFIQGGPGCLALPDGLRVYGVQPHELAQAWPAVRAFLSPLLRWDDCSYSTLSALAHGVPVVVSDRSAMAELLEGAGIVLPLPGRLTVPVAAELRQAELAPWIDAALSLYDNTSFADSQRAEALRAGQRWSAEKLAPGYARFLTGLAARRPRSQRHPEVSLDCSADGLHRLAEVNPWPAQRPEDAAPGQEKGWLGAGTEIMLTRSLSPSTRLVVELGAWLGLSTRFIADAAPAATVISVDHWQGSPEHHSEERYAKLLPRLFETFQARCWDYRERIVPLRTTTLDGLQQVAAHGLKPDFIYVDAEHTFEAVTAELHLARQLFPEAALGGDDYDWKEVRQAVDAFAHKNGMVVDRFGSRGWRLLEGHNAANAQGPPPGRGGWFVLVPHVNGIEMECEQALRVLEAVGVRVVRRSGCLAIDVARNEMVSAALHDEAESILLIDADIGFDPGDALRLLARPEPVVSGVCVKKGMRERASVFAEGVKEVLLGPETVGLYPLKYVGTGFLRLRAAVLRQMITELRLPLCNTHFGQGVWPFFLPLIVPHGSGQWHYLAEGWAFSHRLAQIGATPLADTSFRLWHWGRYGFSWEDAGNTVNRFRSYKYRFSPG